MIADKQRGYAWTRALQGLRARGNTRVRRSRGTKYRQVISGKHG